MLKYKQIWREIKPTRWLIKFNLTPTILMVLESNEVLRTQKHSKVQRTNETLKIEETLKSSIV